MGLMLESEDIFSIVLQTRVKVSFQTDFVDWRPSDCPYW